MKHTKEGYANTLNNLGLKFERKISPTNFRDYCKLLIEIVKNNFFGMDGKPLILTSYQARFIAKVLIREQTKYAMKAATRSGKSEAVSIATLLLASSNANERIIIISPLYKQSAEFFDRIKSHLFSNPALLRRVNKQKSFTKEEVNWFNGSRIKILSSHNAEGLQGFGATVLILDEAASIDDTTYKTRIMRMIMAGRGEPPILIMLSTPHNRNFFFDVWKDEEFEKITVNWQDAVREGQMRLKDVMFTKARISDAQFKVWYEAEFPSEEQDAIYKWVWIEKAIESTVQIEGKWWYQIGVDVAYSNDFTVITVVKMFEAEDFIEVVDIIHKKGTDMMEIAGMVVEEVKKLDVSKVKAIKVDEIGMGRGVVDRLKELNYDVIGFNASTKSPDEKFANFKSYAVWQVRKYFEDGKMKMINNKYLVDELIKMRYRLTSTAKLKVEDPEDKSPDFHDSLVIAISSPTGVDKFVPLDYETTKRWNDMMDGKGFDDNGGNMPTSNPLGV